MKVLVLAARDAENPYLGGGETTVLKYAAILVQEGHHVDYVCATFPRAVHESRWQGVRIHRIAPERLLGPAAFLVYRRDYRGEIDLVMEDILGGARFPFFAPLYVQEPMISFWHQHHLPLFEIQYPRIMLPMLNGLEKLMIHLHRESHILVPSTLSRDDLVTRGGNPDKIHIYHPGVSPSLLNGGPPPSAAERERRFMALGKLRRYKCAHHAIEVIAKVSQRLPDAHLSIVGRPDDRRYLQELVSLARRLGIQGRVDFEIGVSDERKRELLRLCRALIAPAPIEGFGVAIIEAGACGLPVVGTQGIPLDALQEGVNGYRVPWGNIDAFAERVTELLTDDEVFDKLSRRARAFASRFTWERAAAPFLNVVHSIMG